MAKVYTIHKMPDSRGKDGFMYHATGPAIDEALRAGKITQNDTWDPDKEQLILKLRAKGVDI